MSDTNTSHSAVTGAGAGCEPSHTVAVVPPAAADHQPTNADTPTTDPVPTATSPPSTTDPQLNSRPSFVRNCPSSTNRDAYRKKSGKQLAPLLIDESGMGARFHLLDNDIFAARIPGDAPTDADRKKFKSPELRKGMPEREIYPELGAVVQSVLKAAKCKKLRFLDTANHKAKDGNRGRTETFNDAGIYRNTALARHATDLDPKRLAKSKIDREQLDKRILGARSWFWMDVPVEIKGDEQNSAFYFKTKPKQSWADSMHPAAQAVGTQDDQKPSDAKSQGGEGQQEVVEGADRVEESGDVEIEDEDGEEDEDDDDDDDDEDEDEDYEEDDSEEEDTEDDSEDETEDYEGFEDGGYLEGEGDDRDGIEEEGEHPTAGPAADIVKKPVPPFIKLSDNGEKALAQFVEYQLNVFKYQHRTFCYSIYVCFDMARLLYFDRAGAYVSEPFSWVEPTSLLHEFVWKFAKLANADNLGDMGHDTTATLVSPSRRQRFIKEAKKSTLPAHIRAGLKKAFENACPLYELTVEDVPPSRDEWFPDEPFPGKSTPPSSQSSDEPSSEPATDSAPSTRRFIVGRPHFSADALVGRCTKGYMAFDVTNPKKWVPCFVKDSWRPFAPRRTRPEHLVYQRLNRMNVNQTDGIATLICGGDVGGSWAQCTRVQKDLPEANRPVLRIHYRLAIEEIGLPLSEFDNFSELSVIFVDALRAHRQAWDLAGVLHRDVSVGNIMIRVQDGRRSGFLIDWDLSRLECELAKGPVEPDRTGTWQFRSALSLRYPWKPYQRSDDIESFIHAYIYLVLRYHPTSVGGLKTIVETLFEGVSLIEGIKIGGDAKIVMLRNGDLGSEVLDNIYLQRLLHVILDHCKKTYANIDYTEMERLYGPVQTPARPGPPTQHSGPGQTKSRKKPSVLRASDRRGPGLNGGLYGQLKEAGAHQGPAQPADPCQVGTFLSDPWELMTLLAEHAEETYELDDKAPDQFIARKIQDVFRPSDYAGCRSIGTLSITGSFPSGHVSQDAPMAGSSDIFTTGSARVDLPGGGLPSGPPAASKKRTYASRDGDEDIADDEEESSDERRTKRAKGQRGKAASHGQGNRST